MSMLCLNGSKGEISLGRVGSSAMVSRSGGGRLVQILRDTARSDGPVLVVTALG